MTLILFANDYVLVHNTTRFVLWTPVVAEAFGKLAVALTQLQSA